MVISHKHKYVFFELPRTASTAISKELCENYDAEYALSEHATYDQFVRYASDQEKDYFTFTCIRHPMDKTISLYYKFKSDQKKPLNAKKHLFKHPKYYFANLYFARRYFDIQKNNLKFDDYFLKYFHLPYDDTTSISHKNIDFTIKFENIQEDFSIVLKKIGITQIRPLPQFNTTKLKKKKQLTYHYTEKTIYRARFIFGPFMNQWGYEFPSEWGSPQVPKGAKILKKTLLPIRRIFWHLLK